MTNTSIADELIYGQSNIDGYNTSQEQENSKEEEEISTRVVSTRYKFYLLISILVGGLLLYSFLLPAYDKREAAKKSLQAKQQQVDAFQTKKKEAEDNVVLIKKIENEHDNLLNCINNEDGCATFTGKNLQEIKDYLNLNNLSNEKMVIDEKRILQNLSEFLLKKNDKGEYNGSIEGVFIGEEEIAIPTRKVDTSGNKLEKADDQIYTSPIDLKIAFDNKDDLLSFVDNIEKKILNQKEYRILYHIDNIKYDILKSQEKQSVEISMYMFYTR